ncbi:MAG: KGG domain-containing protein [Candidatus Dadabacteria bacterium]
MTNNEMEPRSEEKRSSSRRGFAAMDPERQRQIASQGGRAAHQQGVAHEWSADEARQAGRKGGQNSGTKRRNRGEDRGPIL